MRAFLGAFVFGLQIAGVIASAVLGVWLLVGLLLVSASATGWLLAQLWLEATGAPPAQGYRETERTYW
jgi:uncharacterized protein (DUF58 family)